MTQKVLVKCFELQLFEDNKAPLTEDGKIDYAKDFFGKETNLTVSGQLEAETFAMALGKSIHLDPHLELRTPIQLAI